MLIFERRQKYIIYYLFYYDIVHVVQIYQRKKKANKKLNQFYQILNTTYYWQFVGLHTANSALIDLSPVLWVLTVVWRHGEAVEKFTVSLSLLCIIAICLTQIIYL